MKVFISFSGERSKLVAEALRNWLPDVIQAVQPWMSEDLDPGVRWNDEIARQLEASKFGVICLTPENLDSPWACFEAGAIAKTLDNTFVCPYLIDIDISTFARLPSPLVQFQAARAHRDGTFFLVRCINKALGGAAVPEERLKRAFELWWPNLESTLKQVPKARTEREALSISASNLGLESVHPTRAAALERFDSHLREEVDSATEKAPARVWIVASAMVGLLNTSGEFFDGEKFIRRIAAHSCDFRLLLTHPDKADLRAAQETRPVGNIGAQIRNTLERLKSIGISREAVRYYKGTPTVFAIATTERMMINPYPYEREAHRCFSLIARATTNLGDIYHQYLDSHFEGPWNHSDAISEAEWNALTPPPLEMQVISTD